MISDKKVIAKKPMTNLYEMTSNACANSTYRCHSVKIAELKF